MEEEVVEIHPVILGSASKRWNLMKWRVAYLIVLVLIFVFYYTQNSIKDQLGSVRNCCNNSANAEVKYLIHTSKCRIPDDDPFNEDVKRFIRKENYIPCSAKPLLTYIEKRNSSVTLNINNSLLATYSYFDLSCCYASVERQRFGNISDDSIKFSAWVYFDSSIEITNFIVFVKCIDMFKNVVYANVHVALSPHLHVNEGKIKRDWLNRTVPFNILFVGIDSISKMNLVRTMPKTHRFLEDNDFINLKGYTKIGDNTFPNLMAILTGRTWTQVYDYCDPKKKDMNGCDIIWDRFSKLGYITAYAEDESAIGTFNYYRKGFADPPTDFYFRPYIIAAEQLNSIKRFRMYTCTGPENTGERLMNLAKEFLVTFKDYPTFGFFWMNSFSHENLNLPSSMDEKIEMFLKDIYGQLENTIFVFFSDHGFRFGDIRYTHTGWLEERLPFIYVHLPKNLKLRYPQETRNFVINSQRLTTPYDLYMTLQDTLKFADSSYQVKESQACPKCHSLFSEISENRTCADSAIEQHWCLCSGHSYIDPRRNIVIDTAKFVVSNINEQVKSADKEQKCAAYRLHMIIFSGISETYINEFNQSVNFMMLMLQTIPSAMFEATIEVKPHSLPSFRLLGEISRTSQYDKHSKCVQGALKKYCYCHGLLTSVKSAMCKFMKCV